MLITCHGCILRASLKQLKAMRSETAHLVGRGTPGTTSRWTSHQALRISPQSEDRKDKWRHVRRVDAGASKSRKRVLKGAKKGSEC